jgi:hypothetical protein
MSNTNHHNKRQRQETNGSALPTKVYIVIHDKEPQDSGSDYRHSMFLPSHQDTDIIGVFRNYKDAAYAAGEYVVENWDVEDEDDDDDDDDGDEEESGDKNGNNNKLKPPLSYIDWMEDGWYREEDNDANECHDRVHIQEHVLQ